MKRKTIVAAMVIFCLVAGTAAGVGWYAGRAIAPADVSKKASSTAETRTDSAIADDAQNGESAGTETVSVSVFFTDNQFSLLHAENKTVPKTTSAKAAIEELIKGPADAGHIRTIPSGMTIQSVSIEGDLARASFGPTFASLYPQGSAGEMMFIYSVVDTLTGIPGIERVQLLVDGQASSRYGNLDLAQPIQRDESLIAQ